MSMSKLEQLIEETALQEARNRLDRAYRALCRVADDGQVDRGALLDYARERHIRAARMMVPAEVLTAAHQAERQVAAKIADEARVRALRLAFGESADQ